MPNLTAARAFALAASCSLKVALRPHIDLVTDPYYAANDDSSSQSGSSSKEDLASPRPAGHRRSSFHRRTSGAVAWF